MADNFPQIRAAAIDGRCENVFYRQNQLERLHQSLVENASSIQLAMVKEYGYTSSEATSEFYLAMESIKRNYAALNPAVAHDEEYLIANGKDAPSKRVPIGIVYIKPGAHSLFYSIIAPLNAAIAAGSCVILLLENRVDALSTTLRQLLPQALDQETFAITSSSLNDETLLAQVKIVNQTVNKETNHASELVSSPDLRTIAVVDRTADVQLAAREIVAARFSFAGSSPYAPDCVLVNEFAKKAFLQAVVTECAKLGNDIDQKSNAKQTTKSRVEETIATLHKTYSDIRVVVQESRFAVVELQTRDETLLSKKSNTPVIILQSFSSLDDAIDFSRALNSTPFSAAYHFGNPASGKYLTQFIDASVSFVNHIPRQLLIGPLYPANYSIDLVDRYPTALFSDLKAAFINQSPTEVQFVEALSSPNNVATQYLAARSTQSLAAMKRRNGGGTGFFEQAFLINASLILVTTLGISGYAAFLYLKRR